MSISWGSAAGYLLSAEAGGELFDDADGVDADLDDLADEADDVFGVVGAVGVGGDAGTFVGLDAVRQRAALGHVPFQFVL